MPHRPTTPTPSPAPPKDFGRLARRISSWTTNGLFTALVVVAFLGLGRQTLVWWRGDEEPAAASPVGLDWGAGFDDPGQPVQIELGDTPYAMTRQTVNGDAQAAAEALIELGRRSIGQAGAFDGKLGERERQFLARLTEQTPADEDSAAGWRLHLSQGGGHESLPMVVGTRRMPESGDKTEDLRPAGSSASPVPWRVVLWGLVLPAGENQWTAYQFRVSPDTAAAELPLTDVPLPPGSHRVLSIGGAAGDRIVAFEGQASCGEWKRFFAGWFARYDPAADVEWQPSGQDGVGQGWQGHFRGHESNVVVQLTPGKERSLGLVLVTR